MVKLIRRKYNTNLKDWDLERIKQVKKIYNQVSRNIQL